MHRHGLAQRLSSEAQLARLRVPLLLTLSLLLLAIEVCVPPRVHQLILLRLVLLRSFLIITQLRLEDGLVWLIVVLLFVCPIRVVGQVLAFNLDKEIEHVTLLHIFLVLNVRVKRNLDVGEVGQEDVDIEVLIV